MDMTRNINNMRLKLIRANPDGPVLRKTHKKQEDVWFRQNDKSEYVEYLLTTYPGVGGEKLDEGMDSARNDLRSVGLCPSDNDDSEEWFYFPHGCQEGLGELMSSEDDLEDLLREEAGDDEALVNGEHDSGGNSVGDCQNTLVNILPGNKTRKTDVSPSVNVPG